MVLMIVSNRTPRDWERPCFTGCGTSAEEEMLVTVPSPASLDHMPLLMAIVSMAPTPPPTVAGMLNAQRNIEAIASGIPA